MDVGGLSVKEKRTNINIDKASENLYQFQRNDEWR
jgi:hypothetical protein